jgi:nitrate reductase gamma subunit
VTDLELLAFARGPALWGSLAVLFLGSLWRIVAILRLRAAGDLSTPRSTRRFAGALHGIVSRMLPRPEFRGHRSVGTWNGYAYHIGLAVLVFGYTPHIQFITRLTGLAWPSLPNWLVYVFAGLTIVSLFFAALQRATDPVRKLLSGFDDWFSWVVVFLPLMTGMAAIQQSYPPGVPVPLPDDPAPVAIHLLSVELLFVWLPFGRLGHAFLVFFSRGITGAAMERKGAAF